MSIESAAIVPVTVTRGLSAVARAAVEAGVPASTRRTYSWAVKEFADWCDETGRCPAPADADTLAEYATYLIKVMGRSPTSIETARWAILKLHDVAGLSIPSTVGLVSALRGYRAELAETSSPLATPRQVKAAVPDTLRAIIHDIDRGTPAGKRDAAMILEGFAVGGRRSEIAALDIGHHAFQAEGMQVRVYRRKTRKMTHPVVKYRDDPDMCPVRAVQAWIDFLAANGRADGPLYIRIDQHGNLASPVIRGGREIGDTAGRMNGQSVANVIGRRAHRSGLGGNWSGHSLRRGLATAMRQAGHDREAIEDQGGWARDSTAVARYIDEADAWLGDSLEGVL